MTLTYDILIIAQVLSSLTVVVWWNPLIATSDGNRKLGDDLIGFVHRTCASSETLFINRVDLFADYRQSRLSLLFYFRINLIYGKRREKFLLIINIIFCIVFIILFDS